MGKAHVRMTCVLCATAAGVTPCCSLRSVSGQVLCLACTCGIETGETPFSASPMNDAPGVRHSRTARSQQLDDYDEESEDPKTRVYSTRKPDPEMGTPAQQYARSGTTLPFGVFLLNRLGIFILRRAWVVMKDTLLHHRLRGGPMGNLLV